MTFNLANLFPCTRLPEDAHQAKLIGLYAQAQDGLWLQRVKIPGGRLGPTQWAGLAELAREFTPKTPLHLTTRQDIEIHDLTPDQIPGVQRRLQRIGLTSLGAAGDTYRNITVCPCASTVQGSVDLVSLASILEETLRTQPGIYALPRKFKVSLSCSESCGQPWINDLGFVVSRREGELGFRAIGAGSLGPRPSTGIVLFDWIAPSQVPALAVAAVEVFAAHGDRENRARARLRHVRERMGDDAFLRLLSETFEAVQARRNWPKVTLAEIKEGPSSSVRLRFANGDVSPDAADSLAGLIEDGYVVRIANFHEVIVFGTDLAALEAAVDSRESLREAAALKITVVACPGKRWCRRGITHTNPLADRIRREFSHRLEAGTTVALSGCPNGCSHPAVADFGFIGRLVSQDGWREEAFDFLAGGGMGHSRKQAEKVAEKLNEDQSVAQLARALDGSCGSGGV